MEKIHVSHAIIFSKDGKYVFFEKNKRYNGKLTLFGGKSEVGESKLKTIIRELYEETGMIFKEEDFVEFISKDIVTINDILFIGTIYILLVTKKKSSTILSNPNNVSLSFDNLYDGDFAFGDIIEKVRNAHEKIFNN